jgi:hypothetical protein
VQLATSCSEKTTSVSATLLAVSLRIEMVLVETVLRDSPSTVKTIVLKIRSSASWLTRLLRSVFSVSTATSISSL